MSRTMKKKARAALDYPDTWASRAKHSAYRTANKVGPMAGMARDSAIGMAGNARDYAGSARDVASSRLEDARYWAAPRLDHAAVSFEEQIAPRVAAMMAEMARRIDPAPPIVRRRTRMPMMVLLGGLAMGAIGFALYKRNARQWADTMSDTKEAVRGKVEHVRHRAQQAGETMEQKADEMQNRMS
ncbi:hypothetical protein FDA94_30085 [Herbidospora galbida]|uniref:YtxH domain-containing protein n=1 Tax=Herbidospora galbida TaxID=2575442 RepID=A0A4U3M9S3_9ACTN|nr:hypothetical protein [Herbidospora galbida]TKK84387.1 hypothetical protein FDA94_30085 [Herbidospora galbida]